MNLATAGCDIRTTNEIADSCHVTINVRARNARMRLFLSPLNVASKPSGLIISALQWLGTRHIN